MFLHRPTRPRALRAPAASGAWLRLLLACLSLSLGLPALAGPAAAVVLTQARFADTPAGPWTTIALPDTWAQRGRAPRQDGVYRLTLTLAHDPGTPWALRIDRLSSSHEVRVNGQLLDGDLQADVGLIRPQPTLVTVPVPLLHAGLNDIEIRLRTGARAGLSRVTAGPQSVVAEGFIWRHHREMSLPQGLNVAGMGVALFMLLLWAMRRSEAALGSFGALGLLTSLRNLSYYHSLGTVSAAPVSDLLFYEAQVLSALLLGTFAIHFTELPARHLARWLRALAWTLLPAGLVAALMDQLQPLRALVYPLLLATIVPVLWLAGRRALRSGSNLERVLPLALLVVLGAGIHDYAYQLGHAPITDEYWMPYAVPVTMMSFAALLTRRLVGALGEVERMNQTLERRVQERTRELQAANAAKTRFLAAASHDLRQPMATIGLLVSLLREQPGSTGQHRLLDRLQEAAGAMETLLGGLLDFSRLESGATQVRRQAVALQALFDTVASHCEELAWRKGLRLVMRPTTASVDTDPVLLEQVLRNLVGNAVRYTERGGVLVGVRPAGPGHVRLLVADTGPGIAPQAQQQVFEAFVQLHNHARDRSQGVGLGLSIVKHSLALLEAPLTLNSVPGRGSVFAVTLPRVAPSPRPGGTGTGVQALDENPTRALAGQCVWLVEDDRQAREAMTLRLAQWGARVQACASLGEVRAALASGVAPPPQMLLTDQRLPDGSGLDAVALMRAAQSGLPAIVLTAESAPLTLQQLAASGVQLLHKPCPVDTLLQTLSQALAAPVGADGAITPPPAPAAQPPRPPACVS